MFEIDTGNVIWKGVRRTVYLTHRHQSTHITHRFPNLDLYADCSYKHLLWTYNGDVINSRREQTAANYEIIVLFLFSATVYSQNFYNEFYSSKMS